MTQSFDLREGVAAGGVAVGVLLGACVCLAVAAQWWVIGSADGGWTYPYVASVAPRHALVFAGIAGVATILLLFRVTRRTAGPLLLAWILAATAAHGVLRMTAPFDIETLFLSPGANSFYTLARERTPADILGRFERVRRQAPLHAQSNMPGKTLLIHALEQISRRTDVLPWLVVFVSNLGALLMFAVARELYGDLRTPLYAAVLYLFTPARVLFFPIMNTVTPVFVLAFAWLAIRWLRTAHPAYAATAGVALYGLVFFEPLPLVIGLFVAAIALAAIMRGDLRFDAFVIGASIMALVFMATAALVYWQTGFHLWRAFARIGEHAVEFNKVAARPYAVWVVANLPEFVFGAGPAPFIAAVTGLFAWKARSAREWIRDWRVSSVLGLLAVLIATDVIGINRGEVIRLWIFLACFFQLPAAALCSAVPSWIAMTLVLGVTLLQISLAMPTIAFVFP